MLLKEIETVKADEEDSDIIIDLKPVRGFEDLLHQYEAVADVWYSQVEAIGFIYSKTLNFDFFKYSLIRNKFGTHWIKRIWPIHDLF